MGPAHLSPALWAAAGLHGAGWLWLVVLMAAGLLFGSGLRALLVVRTMGPAGAGPKASRGRPGCAGCPMGGACSAPAAERCEKPAQGASPAGPGGSMPR